MDEWYEKSDVCKRNLNDVICTINILNTVYSFLI